MASSSSAEGVRGADNILERYRRAAQVQAFDADRVLNNSIVHPRWIGERDFFWYRRDTAKGHEFVIVDAGAGRRSLAFDHDKLAEKLRREAAKNVVAAALPLRHLAFSLTVEGQVETVRFLLADQLWEYAVPHDRLTRVEDAPSNASWVVSPDGQWAIYSQDYNLWVKNLSNGGDRQLTWDGGQYYVYGAAPDAAGGLGQKPNVIWSPDSRRILTEQTDDRKVRELPGIDLAPNDGLKPAPLSIRTALPGDEHVPIFRMTAIDVNTGRQTPAKYAPVPAVRMYDTPIYGNRAWWGKEDRAYFVDLNRGETSARVVEFDTNTGETRILFTESDAVNLELSASIYGNAELVPLRKTNELLWFSERSGWAHLYLYNLETGKLKKPVTGGDWRVREILAVDEDRREIFLAASSRHPGRNPYYREIMRVGIDDGAITVLSASNHDHVVYEPLGDGLQLLHIEQDDVAAVSGISPSYNYFVETRTRVDEPPCTVLNDRRGKLVLTLECPEKRPATENWQWPEPVALVSADGVTDIRGVVFRPSGFTPDTSYPVIDFVYGGPQSSHAPTALGGATFMTAQSLAELGFIVVIIDGRGTAERSKAFRAHSYGAVERASDLEDHIAGIRQLAERYDYMDLNRVGITGFSAGGYMTAIAMLRYPGFYKTGVAIAGNYDQRLFWHSWGERYQGMPTGDNYKSQAAATYAANLTGNLLFIHGLRDMGVHPAGLFQLVQSLTEKGKTFDMLLLPRDGHEMSGYVMVRMWDYFVRHLAGEEPPKGFSASTASELRRQQIRARIEADD